MEEPKGLSKPVTLKKELAHHPELEFQEQYIRTLNRVENYYRKRR